MRPPTRNNEAHGLRGRPVAGGGAPGRELVADGGEGLEGQGDVLLPLEAVERDDGALFVVLMVLSSIVTFIS